MNTSFKSNIIKIKNKNIFKSKSKKTIIKFEF